MAMVYNDRVESRDSIREREIERERE